MTAPKRSQRQAHAIGKKGRRSLGVAILARTLADRRLLIRKMVIGEAVGERPRRGLYAPPPILRDGEGDPSEEE